MLGFDWRRWCIKTFRRVSGTARRKGLKHSIEALEERTLLTFAAPVITDYPTLDSYLVHEATGDFNGDGKLDIATLSYLQIGQPLKLIVLQGDGAGSFQAQPVITLANVDSFDAFNMAVGRVNGDSYDDLVMLNGTFEMKVFQGSANGLTANNSTTTALTVSVQTGTTNPAGQVLLGHFTRTDRLDVAILPFFGNDMRLMVNQGDGTFVEQPVPLQNANHQDAELNVNNQSFDEGNQALVEDLNADGLDDAIFSFGKIGTGPNAVSGVLTIKKTSGPDIFTVSSVAAGSLGQDLQGGDINGDGLLDLAVKSLDGTGGIKLFQGQADGSFQVFATSPFIDGDSQVQIATAVIGNFAGSPAGDLAINITDGISAQVHDGTEYIFGIAKSLGNGQFGPVMNIDRNPNGSDEGFITEAGRLLVGDVDGDGTQDLINLYPNFREGRTSVLLNAGGTHTTMSFPDLQEGSPITIVANVDKIVPSAPGVPTGTVTFKEGNTVLGSATIVDGVATSDLLFLDPGLHTISAVYSGDDDYFSSVAGPTQINVIVNPGRTATKLDFPNLIEDQALIHANISKYFPATAGDIDGTVTFMEDNQVIGQADVVGGDAVGPLDLAAGVHTIHAVYSGNGTFTTSKSKDFTITVQPAPIPDLGLLHIEADSGGLRYNRANQHFEASGVIHIGLSSNPSESLLDLDGSISVGLDSIVAEGTVTAHIGSYSQVLFAGTFQFNIGHAETVEFDAPAAPGSLKVAGLGVNINQLELVNGGINIGGRLQLPNLFGDHLLTFAVGAGLHVDASGVTSHFSGGAIGFPNVDFDLAGLGIKASDLSVDYDSDQDRLKIQGKVMLPDLFGGIIAGTTADLTGNDFIQVKAGEVDVVGDLTIKRIDIVPNNWTLKDVKLHIDTITNSFEGSAKLFLPGGFGVSADIALVNGQLDKVDLGVAGLNLAIPFLPGAFLQSLSGGVSGLTTNHPTFDGEAEFTYLPSVSFDLPSILGGQHFSISIVSLDVTAEVDTQHLTATGTVELFKGVKNSGQNNGSPASVDLDWLKKAIHITTDVHLFDNIINLSVDFTGNAAGNVSFKADATINLPDIDTGILGIHISPQTLAGAHAELHFTNDHNPANDYFVLHGDANLPILGHKQIGVKIYFNGKVDFLGLKDPVGQTFNIPAGSDTFMLTATWENDVGNVPIEVVDPNGTVYTEADFNNTTIGLIAPLSGPTSKSVGLLNPIPGDWTIRIPNETGLGQVAMHGFYEVAPPTLAINSLTPGVDGIAVNYDAITTESDAKVTFFYDTDNVGFDGPMIAADIAGTGAGQSYVWNTTGIAAGTYYVYAMIDDGINAPVYVYSPTSVTIANQPPVVSTIADQNVNEGATLTLTAAAVDPNGDTVTYSLGSGAPEGIDIDPATGELTWTPTEAQGPANYTISVVATDTGTPALSGTQMFHVAVADVNSAPKFEKIFALSSPKGGDFSFSVAATDADVPAQTLTYSLDAGAPTGATINPTTGAFSWQTSSLTQPGVYPITFRATDNGTSPLSATATVNLTVIDALVPGHLDFSAANYTVTEGGQATITVTRTIGSDGAITVQYATSSGGATEDTDFTATSGILIFEDGETSKTFTIPTLHDSVDETPETVNLSLSNLMGGGSFGDQQHAELTINESVSVPPVFTSLAHFNVAENQTAVGTVTATDADIPAQTVTFSITGGPDASKFGITSSGVLTFNTAPDFENPTDIGTDHIYNLQVTADDGAGGATTQDIAVTVTAVNDNSPAFTSGTTLTAAENQTAVGTVAATDADVPSQTVTFSITGGADAAKFSITNSGVLTFVTAPDFEHPTDSGADNGYTLQVTASDGNGRTTVQDITVTVTDVSDSVAPHLDVGSEAVTWTKKQTPVVVLPAVLVTGTDLGGGTLTITINAIGKKKPTDLVHFPSFNSLGTSTGVAFTTNHLSLQIQLGSNVTTGMIQSFLRGITFSTKGAGLNVQTRTLSVTLTNSLSQSSSISQTIHVIKKAPKPPR